MDNVTCECGAVYARYYEKVMFRDKDSYECSLCNRTLDTWNGSRIPVFDLVSVPDDETNK